MNFFTPQGCALLLWVGNSSHNNLKIKIYDSREHLLDVFPLLALYFFHHFCVRKFFSEKEGIKELLRNPRPGLHVQPLKVSHFLFCTPFKALISLEAFRLRDVTDARHVLKIDLSFGIDL